MLHQTVPLLLAMAGLLASHFVLSHILRARLVAVLGEGWFRLVYSFVAIVMLALVRMAYRDAPEQALAWSGVGVSVQIVYDVLTYLALVLLLGAFSGNPALVGANLTLLHERQPEGVLRITRHPMLFGIALWSLAEILIMPTPRKIVFYGGLVVLALAGAALQDRKKAILIGTPWQVWTSRTHFWPDLRQAGAAGLCWLAAVIPWLLLTLAHSRFGDNIVGIWVLFPGVAE